MEQDKSAISTSVVAELQLQMLEAAAPFSDYSPVVLLMQFAVAQLTPEQRCRLGRFAEKLRTTVDR